MKPKTNTLSKNYLPIRVFLDDLELIETFLSATCSDLSIETSDFEYSSVEELKTKCAGARIKKLKISAHRPYTVVELEPLWARLYCGSDDTTGTGVYFKLDSVLSKCQRQPSFLYSYWSYWGINLFLLAGILVPSRFAPRTLVDVLTIVLFCWITRVSYIRLFKSSDVCLVHKRDRHNFYSRNRDQVLIGLLIALVTAILSAVATTYLTSVQDFLRSLVR